MKNTKININREKKSKLINEISEKVIKAKAIVFTNYTGLTHKQLEMFKKNIKKSKAEFSVTKNTLLKRSLKESKIENVEDKSFEQPTGTIFLYEDIVNPLKILVKMIKDFEKPTIKFGLLEGKLMSKEEVMKLSSLPSREVLIAQLLGQMNSPISGLQRALNWNFQKFLITLNAILEKKKASI